MGGGPMTVPVVLDSAGRHRRPATMPGYHAGRPPRNKGMRYPADPPTVEEILAVMCRTRENRYGWRLRAMIVVLWRGGLRTQEALALAASCIKRLIEDQHKHRRQGRHHPSTTPEEQRSKTTGQL